MEMTGAKIVMECLLEQDVNVIFGYPGGTILNVYDALYDYRDRICHILTAHEQGAAHAADGYARSTGKTGVCFATSGPGATNLITGIATAYMDSSPVVFLTCNVAYSLLGKDAFQEIDITGITMPITKSNYQVRDVNHLADTIREAFAVAESGRPGPVLIDIMKDVTAAVADYQPLPKAAHRSHGHLGEMVQRKSHVVCVDDPDSAAVDQLIALIQQAKRPMIICGGGVVSANASAELCEFAEKLNAPVASTMMGLGCMPTMHPLYTGMIGMHGARLSNVACTKCDLLIAVGTRLNDRVALNPGKFQSDKTMVHIEVDSSEINKNVKTDFHILGDAKKVLALLNRKLAPRNAESDRWFIQLITPEVPGAELRNADGLHPLDILRSIYEMTQNDVIIVTDVGQHQMWTAQNFPFSRPRQFISSGGFGTMGFGLGAAMGAKIGNPTTPVVEITGDGCFRMNCNELSTVEHYKIPVITVIFNNGTLGMVRQWQDLLYKKRYSETTLDRGPDFVKLAQANDIQAYRAETLADFQTAFGRAYASGKPAVIDCRIDIDEKVTPMVQSGKHLSDFLLS